MSKRTDVNAHVREFLDYFLKLKHAPNYAVMLKGPWGSGKTHFIKSYLATRFDGNQEQFLYVSLFGLKTREEIDSALMQAAYPALGWKVTKLGGRLGMSLLKTYTGFETDITAKDIVGRVKANTLIFDDLERCDLNLNSVLGYINEFVEHDECKVIILANEKEIIGEEGYERRREKLIGKTLAIHPEFESAYNYFITLIDDKATKDFLVGNSAEVAAVYHQSELGNFRILLQTMWDFERLYSVLSKRHHENTTAMLLLARMFFALSFDFRSGRILAQDIAERCSSFEAIFNRMADQESVSRLDITQKRYAGVAIYDPVLSNEVMTEILVEGVANAAHIQESVNVSEAFVDRGHELAWRTAWHWTERSDEEVETALVEVWRQFSGREFKDMGEFGQVVSLLVFFAKEGILEQPLIHVMEEAKKYVDDLYQIDGLENGYEEGPMSERSYAGLGFHPSDEFKEIFSYVKKRRNEALLASYPKKAELLLEEMKSDPNLFFRRINVTNEGTDNLYARFPILTYIDPKIFLKVALEQPTATQRMIFMSLNGRYEHGMLDRELAQERPWLRQLKDEMDKAASTAAGIKKYRIGKFFEWNIAPYLSRGDGPEKSAE